VLLSAADLQFDYPRGAGGRGGRTDSGVRVIDGVSLNVAAGDVVGILGPNGSGKTTLLRLLSGVLNPASGRVAIGGAPMAEVPRRTLAQRVALVPQETSLAFDYTAVEIVLMGRYPHLGAFEIEGPEDLASAMRALEATGTASFADRPFRTLSGGEKQRVVIASALAQLDAGVGQSIADKMLMLDEPTASLDLKYQFEVAALLRRLHDASGLTILLSTHDLRFASSMCTRIVLLSAGRILAQGTPREVLTPDLIGRLFDVPPALAAPILQTDPRDRFSV
jgi:iron complex transport system ATP-binding protein